ncbi:MAG TPA: chorismate mutase, partial [Solirubrobacteraceae bacterium]|nr:chorismate mutase [Solirubrobacteraceae bacterium]
MQLFALRGAINVERNEAGEILAATTELMEAIMERNGLRPDAVV